MSRSRICSDRLALALVALVLAAPAVAQEATTVRRFVVTHRSVDDAYQLVVPFLSDRAEIHVRRAARELQIQDSSQALDLIAQALAAFDVERRRVKLWIRLVKGERLADGEIAEVDDAGIPANLSRLLGRVRYEPLGEGELTIEEGETDHVVVGEQDRFRVEVELGDVDLDQAAVELTRLTLARRQKSATGEPVYRPIIEFSELLQTDRTRVLVATPRPGDRRALFLLLRVIVDPA